MITIVLVLIIALLLVSGYFFALACYRKNIFGNKEIGETPTLSGYQMERLLDSIEWLEAQNIETVRCFARKGISLNARLIRNNNSKKVAILVHGYRSGSQNFACIAKHYFDMGFSILLPDQRAHGDSEGNFITFGYEESTDMFFWTRYIQHNFGKDVSIVYHGVSMGAATVAMMPEMHLPRCIKGLIVDCGYTSATEIFEYILKKDFKIPKILAMPILKVASLISEVVADFPFDECNTVEAVKKAKIPMLFIHGTEDKFVPWEMGAEMYGACSSDVKDLLLVEGAGHAMSYLTDSKLYEERLDAFLSKII